MKPSYQVWTRKPGGDPEPIAGDASGSPFTTDDPKKADDLARACTEDPFLVEAIVTETKAIKSYPGMAAPGASTAPTRKIQKEHP